MTLLCATACLQCDWKQDAASMKAADKACDQHAKATSHSTSWHCWPATSEGSSDREAGHAVQ